MTRVEFGLVANDATLAAVGYAALYAFGLARLRLADLGLVGLSYLVGWALMGSLLSLGLVAGIGPGVMTVLIVAAALVTGCVFVGVRTSGPGPRSHPRGTWHALALLPAFLGAAVLVVVSLAAVAVALSGKHYPDYLDAFAFWIPKAETIYYSHGLDANLWGTILHPEYPPLLAAMDAGTFHFVGGFHPSLLPLQATLLGIAFLLSSFTLVDRFAPRWISLPTLALLATTPWFWWRLQTPLADQPLAYLIATAAIACVIWLHERHRAWLAVAFVLLAGATLTKLEGGFMAGLLAVVVAVAGLVLHRREALPALALPGAPLAIVPWRLWLQHHDLPTSSPDYRVSDFIDPGYLAARTGRFTGALQSLLQAPFAQRQTAVIVYAAVGAVVAAAWRRPVIAAAVGAWLTLSIVGLATTYWVGRLELASYLSTSANRVGTTVIIAASALTPLLLGLALQPAAAAGDGALELQGPEAG